MSDSEPMHLWFGLSYSAYLVLHRTLIQSMPDEWQARLVALLDEAQETIDTSELPIEFNVRATRHGKYIADHWRDYERGRRRMPRRKS